jgi:hypothetical protein
MIRALVALLSLQLILSPDLSAGVQHMLGIIAFFGLSVYFARATDDESVWYWLAIVNGVAAAAGGLVYYVQQDQLRYINANAWAFLPLTALFSACLSVRFSDRDRRGQPFLWGLVLTNVVWVVLSGSRGGLLIALSCVFFLISAIPGLSRRFLYLAGGFLLGCALAIHFADRLEYVQHRLDKSIDSQYSLASRTSGRSDLAIGGWRMFLANPIQGVGTGGFAVSWARLDDREGMSDYRAGQESEAHSGWIKTLAEAGLPGFLLHAGFVLSFAVVGWRSRQRQQFYLGLLVTTSLLVSFISTEFQAKGIWFFAAGAIVVLSFHRSDEMELIDEEAWAAMSSGARATHGEE